VAQRQVLLAVQNELPFTLINYFQMDEWIRKTSGVMEASG